MRTVFHPEADADFVRALRHYVAIDLELGRRFLNHVDGLIAESARQPTLFRIYRTPQVRPHFRRPFPCALVYVGKTDYIWVLAVMHFKQPPDYWRRRLEN